VTCRLFLDLRPGEAIRIGGEARVAIEEKSGQRVRLRVEAEGSVPIVRDDIKIKQNPGR
jgi:sRNA-binding carbon storage regulator CsrA